MTQAIVYTSTNCVYCKQLKSYLTEQKITFEERNVDESEVHYGELQALGMMSLPVTVIGDYKILGMNTLRIQKALAAVST